jgi:hypothetical protein
MEQAQKEHRDRLLVLHDLQSELEVLWMAIEDGEPTAFYEQRT